MLRDTTSLHLDRKDAGTFFSELLPLKIDSYRKIFFLGNRTP